ncbi:hypothetical protein TGFOU_464917, partial [Toxoplasma gondii FOU]
SAELNKEVIVNVDGQNTRKHPCKAWHSRRSRPAFFPPVTVELRCRTVKRAEADSSPGRKKLSKLRDGVSLSLQFMSLSSCLGRSDLRAREPQPEERAFSPVPLPH